ncbi:hypothetical protein DSO57_1007389 [Entomophthora muscae]|uniref:Uncharacterized protein n=1 Tax=Entomophthora muscae TaxID=34485 RepID=A0ACC2TUR6_9FUNG|nr:hypothetical protein DSO57_1007389 [Entomophthora muscae]
MIPYYFLPDIFKYLERKNQCQLRLVSREWNEFLLPFVFSRLSTGMYGGFEKLLRKYSEFVKELHLVSLDDNMIGLLSACKKTTRLFINLGVISPEAALILGEKFPLLSYLELWNANSAKVSYLSPLTRKVKTLYYYPDPCENKDDFMTYYRDFDCPLVTHLIIEEEDSLAGHNFSHIVKRFPAVETFEFIYTVIYGYQFEYFVYDVENMVFKEIRFPGHEEPLYASLRFHNDIPPKTPLLSSHQEVTHESQFHALLSLSTCGFVDLIPQFTYLDAIHIIPECIEQEFIELLLSLKDIRSLSFDFKYQRFSTDLFKETFKATTVFLEVPESELPVVLEWLASCLPNLEELGIHLRGSLYAHDETKQTESKLIFEFWENLVEKCPNLSKIHLSDDLPFLCQIKKKYPHISVDNKRKAKNKLPRYYFYALLVWILSSRFFCELYNMIRGLGLRRD